MHKSKFNKSKCSTCRFRGNLSSTSVDNIYCNYTTLADKTCLHRVGKQVRDRRGSNYNNCKLYSEGKRMQDKADWKENNMAGLRSL